jgi:two-component system, chemotaxis family, chemotaxis protein CheY
MKTIFLVDDSRTVLLAMSKMLTNAGYETENATCADEGLIKLNGSLRPNLLITDLEMPGMSGIEFIKEVRKLPKHRFLPILFHTTESQQHRRDEAKAAGASGWLVKPVEVEQLLHTIKLVIK